MTRLKTLGIDTETHKLLRKIQADIYEDRDINYDLKEIIRLLVMDTKNAKELIVRNVGHICGNKVVDLSTVKVRTIETDLTKDYLKKRIEMDLDE